MIFLHEWTLFEVIKMYTKFGLAMHSVNCSENTVFMDQNHYIFVGIKELLWNE